ncbi:MAG: asparagine synthase (glutamine-hydrolyzing) [Phycisphaeraceae bacterium]
MCGIAGILGQVNDANRAALRRMGAAVAHRGPDSDGEWISAPDERGEGCLLAHRRLSILDLTDAADQPMVDPRSGHVLVYNGELYNYQALRATLVGQGEAFGSTGDTAVMLRALARDGCEALSRFRGMFAFGLWDPAARRLTLARDPLGMKPLYVCVNPAPAAERAWSVMFASELRAILASGLIERPRLDPEAVASVAWNGFVMGPTTAVAGVESLMPGEARVYGGRGQQEGARTYWHMPAPTDDGPTDEEALAEALAESVALHLHSDAPLGVFLSSGVDSACTANLAHRHARAPINTFTLAFEEAGLSEGPRARRIAEAIGTNHHEIVLSEDEAIDTLEAAIDSLDQPTFDGLNSYYISRAVRQAGLKVALAGTGGDELFGGYRTFRELPMLRAWARRTGWVPRRPKVAAAQLASRTLQRGGSTAAPQTRWAKLPAMVEAGADAAALYQLAYALFLPDFQAELLQPQVRERSALVNGLTPAMRDRLRAETERRSTLAGISVMEQRCFLGERLLRDTDAASMAVGLETRLPLVDTCFVEQVNRLPDRLRYQPVGRKQMLRRIGLHGLDPALFDQPKQGFVMPYERWIRQRLGKRMDELMRDERAAAAVGLQGGTVARLWEAYQAGAPGMYWSRVWAPYVLMRWCHKQRVFL